MNDTVSITDLKQNTASVIGRLKGSNDPILVLQRSEIAAVLIDPSRFRAMELLIARLEELEDIQSVHERSEEETITSQDVARQLA